MEWYLHDSMTTRLFLLRLAPPKGGRLGAPMRLEVPLSKIPTSAATALYATPGSVEVAVSAAPSAAELSLSPRSW